MNIAIKIKVGAILLAGGKGTRFGEQKQFIQFNGVRLWEYVYEKIAKIISKENIVVVGVDVPGGDTRSFSVMNGLSETKADIDRVIIIEAARPLVTVSQLNQLAESESRSVSFAMPLVNTVIGRDGTYYNRNDMYELLTPQAFDYKLLKDAYDSKKYTDMTDETRVMYEHYGIKPDLIETTPNLLKITYQRDLAILENLKNRYMEVDIE